MGKSFRRAAHFSAAPAIAEAGDIGSCSMAVLAGRRACDLVLVYDGQLPVFWEK